MEIDQEEITTFAVKKIYDPFLRFLHWWNALSLFSLMLTIWFKGILKEYPNGKDIIYRLHIYIGYALSIGIIARIIWGFVGCKHARFKTMLYFYDWVKILKTRKYDSTPLWGHDRYASLSYLLFYFMMIYQVFSGLCLAAKVFGMGPLSFFIAQSKGRVPWIHNLKQIHEIVFYVSMFYVVAHIGMIIFHEIKGKYPVAQSMVSGFQYRKKKE